MHKVTLSNNVEFMCSETQITLEVEKVSNVVIGLSYSSDYGGVLLALIWKD